MDTVGHAGCCHGDGRTSVSPTVSGGLGSEVTGGGGAVVPLPLGLMTSSEADLTWAWSLVSGLVSGLWSGLWPVLWSLVSGLVPGLWSGLWPGPWSLVWSLGLV